ncbi:transcription-repair coupling factor [bacterium]|nr:transcription-repair coupling factor [bacterium]|tara:strand:+ start:843 stop:2963 length:2121 start_codon:yes stop_codon:yes gene_type:complete
MKKLVLSLDQTYSQHKIIKQLVTLNYTRTKLVLEVGDVAIRGDIMDIFPAESSHPIRLEFDLDTVSRIHYFSTHTQRVTKPLQKATIITFDTTLHKPKGINLNESYIDHKIIENLFENDYVIHEEYGLGKFKGLRYKTFRNTQGEYIILEYKKGDTLYIPINQINRIHKYEKTTENPPLNSLNDAKWQSQKKKAKADTLRLAEELFITYKTRNKQHGFAYAPDTELQLIIEQEFPYQLTPDQEKAIQAIKRDMEHTRPMDRLICGDVGYGKTELLVRATLKALDNQKQVAILVPTTLLAEQHFQTFTNRLKNTPYIIKCLSRFIAKKEQKHIIKQLKQNQCDCIIATHRLLSKDISFSNLGLLIVDEEQRFGVTHKEALKMIKPNVDILNVSATPIPRTLYLSLSGSRDFSVIETAPKNRKPILTYINPLDDQIIKQAIQNELKRNGQLFYVYNNIKTIQKKASYLTTLLPTLRIGIIHAQLQESHIKHIMTDFKQNKYDCLLSTTIVENGLDIPNANTIILDGAETFGLAQIHQLRGRVGRSNQQAYAYLLYNDKKTLSEKASKRLEAIKEYVSLGSGYDIALRDLEIRGAGSVLGKEQHGHVLSIGFSYYCKLLEESVKQKKGTKKTPRYPVFETNYITISDTYISEPRERIAIYKQILQCQTITDCQTIQDDLQDRYGRFDTTMIDMFEYIRKKIDDIHTLEH